MVPPGDVAALADALARVIEDESLRARLARGARSRFLEAFDISHYAIRLGKLHAGLFKPAGLLGASGERVATVKHLSDQREDHQLTDVSKKTPRVNILGVRCHAGKSTANR